MCELTFTAPCRYGGGPAVNHLYVCHTCQIEIEKLEKRRKSELDMFVRVSLLTVHSPAARKMELQPDIVKIGVSHNAL